MPPRRSALGRGLDALIAAAPPSSGESAGGRSETPAVEVELGRIEPNPRQPRRQIDQAQLAELADSIREHGLLQPLLVSRLDTGAGGGTPESLRYRLIAGQRRWEAAKLAGLARVPVVVREATPRQLLELALVENVQRADLNPLEEAAAFQQLAHEFGLTQDEIAQRVGKSRFAVANTLRLLHAPASVQQALLDGHLSEGHARALLGAGDAEVQRRLAQQVIDSGLSVRQTEELARRAQQATAAPRPRRRAVSTDVLELEELFQEALGTKVKLTRSKRGGRVIIHFYDDEQLENIYNRLAGAS